MLMTVVDMIKPLPLRIRRQNGGMPRCDAPAAFLPQGPSTNAANLRTVLRLWISVGLTQA